MALRGSIKSIRSTVAEVEFLDEQPRIFDILTLADNPAVKLEIIASASEQHYFCFILSDEIRLSRGTEVISTGEPLSIPVGDAVLGRAFDIFGTPHDGKAPLATTRKPIHSHKKTSIEDTYIPSEVITTGIRAIDFFTPILKGSKTGLVGGAGLGKTILLTELIHNVVTNNNKSDSETVSVFSAVGERSREAHELLETLEASDVLKKTTMVLGQMGENPAVRFRTASASATIAEHFRDEGKDVLFFIDNMYRFSQAGYELATLMKAIPSEEGYQPTLPSEIGTLNERLVSNKSAHITTIEAIYLPSDDLLDYSVRSTFDYLDGYIVLSRDVYQSGRLPAVDLLESNSSALTPETVGEKHFGLYLEAKKVLESAKEIERIVSLVGLSELSAEDQKKYKRSILLQNYMTQSLSVAEPQTGKPGVFATPNTTLIDIEKILSGAFDDADPDLFLYIEKIDDAWKKNTPTVTLKSSGPVLPTNQTTQTQSEPIPMTLSDTEAQTLIQEKIAAKKKSTEDTASIKDKYTATLMAEANKSSQTKVTEHLEKRVVNYTPTKMEETNT